ncbi:MAG: class I SAM-dependent methyltransferase [Alphaproteobacteria bacterium]|nr:class I SAM-dependent methyltransferase [Alphaproteobacteria bacterium]
MNTESGLLSVALALLGQEASGLTPGEREVVLGIGPCPEPAAVGLFRDRILAGDDPLGDGFGRFRDARTRRRLGQVMTPGGLVDAMTRRARTEAGRRGDPVRVVDGGAGTGRFLTRCARLFPEAALVGVELDPVCAILLRANLRVLGLDARTRVVVGDFRDLTLPDVPGWTLHIGNPPYVRHHLLPARWKDWYAAAAAALGAGRASKRAGLHLHFFVKTGLLAREGDLAILVTAAEWLDTRYGETLRALLLGRLGGLSVHVVDARADPFPGTLATAAVTVFSPCFPLGRAGNAIRFETVANTIRFETVANAIRFEAVASVGDLGALSGGSDPATPTVPSGRDLPRVGDFFRVSRGQATGMNAVWLAGNGPPVPPRFLFPCVTGAREVFAAVERGCLDPAALACVIDLPRDLSALEGDDASQVAAFLEWARARGADRSYLARHRSPWWSVRLGEPAPIVCTYMARRPPAFVRNGGARLLNVAHGLYPRLELGEDDLADAVAALNAAFHAVPGRVYAGGLRKFEPRAVEAVPLDWSPSSSCRTGS